jgi:hypothetical protein
LKLKKNVYYFKEINFSNIQTQRKETRRNGKEARNGKEGKGHPRSLQNSRNRRKKGKS